MLGKENSNIVNCTDFDEATIKNLNTSNSFYYDDNSKLYRKNKKLIPNNTYSLNSYTYATNYNGAIILAKALGSLRLKIHKGRLPIKDSLNDIGGGFQKFGDNRGHIIGDQFGGFNGIGNLIPQNAIINGGIFKDHEDTLATIIKAGKNVMYEVKLHYSQNDSLRPDIIIVIYTIDDKTYSKTFKNP